eukprot:g4177.t1
MKALSVHTISRKILPKLPLHGARAGRLFGIYGPGRQSNFFRDTPDFSYFLALHWNNQCFLEPVLSKHWSRALVLFRDETMSSWNSLIAKLSKQQTQQQPRSPQPTAELENLANVAASAKRK